MAAPVFSQHELSTDLNILKTQIFTFKILLKARHFVVKHYINIIYIGILFILFNLFIYFFLDLRFLRSFLYFRYETRILKNKLCKSQTTQIDCVEIAAVYRCSSKQLILKIPQYSQENTCVGDSF